MQVTATGNAAPSTARKPVYVFELPVRVWHWVHALSIVVLAVTGYLIAHPLSAPAGEASENFLMGNFRLVHFVAGYVFAIGFALRIYWAIVGNRYARELFYLPVWRGGWWREFIEELKYYLFLRRDMPLSIAHNPLAQTAMWIFNTLLGLFMIGTGFALYGEGLGLGSWADAWFGWMVPLLGGSQNLKMWHTFGMWLLIMFAIIHIYMAIRAEYMGRQSSLRTMIDGWRTFRD